MKNRKLKILLGKLLYYSLGRLLPVAHCPIKFLGVLGKNIRSLCGKLILCKCGSNVNIYPKAKFSSKVTLGDNSDIGLYAELNGTVIIGNDVIMAPNVVVYTRNHNSSDISIPIKYQGDSPERPVVIGDGTWIGSRVIILPGVNIGANSIVGAGAVVTKSVPDYSVVVGNPGRVVRRRNQND